MLTLQEIKPEIINNMIILNLTKEQYQEICYAIKVLQKKRDAARAYQQKKSEKDVRESKKRSTKIALVIDSLPKIQV